MLISFELHKDFAGEDLDSPKEIAESSGDIAVDTQVPEEEYEEFSETPSCQSERKKTHSWFLLC